MAKNPLDKIAQGSQQLTAIPQNQRGVMNESEMAAELAKLFTLNRETADKVVDEINALIDRLAQKENDEINILVQSATKRTDGTVHDLDANGKSTVTLNEPDSLKKYAKFLEGRVESNSFWAEYGKLRRELNDELQRGVAEIFSIAHRGIRQGKQSGTPQTP